MKLPPGVEHEADFALLADIFPTGWHGLVLSGFQSGESVAVFGAGPVGLMAAYSGIIRGASQVRTGVARKQVTNADAILSGLRRGPSSRATSPSRQDWSYPNQLQGRRSSRAK